MKSKTGILSEMNVAPPYKLLKMPSLQTMLWSKEQGGLGEWMVGYPLLRLL